LKSFICPPCSDRKEIERGRKREIDREGERERVKERERKKEKEERDRKREKREREKERKKERERERGISKNPSLTLRDKVVISDTSDQLYLFCFPSKSI
jgi:hypothetical protein